MFKIILPLPHKTTRTFHLFVQNSKSITAPITITSSQYDYGIPNCNRPVVMDSALCTCACAFLVHRFWALQLFARTLHLRLSPPCYINPPQQRRRYMPRWKGKPKLEPSNLAAKLGCGILFQNPASNQKLVGRALHKAERGPGSIKCRRAVFTRLGV